MTLDLAPEEIESLLEGLDYLKTKVAYVKGGTYDEKTAQLLKLEALDQKLRRALSA